MEEIIEKIEKLREEVEAKKTEKERLSGKIDNTKASIKEIEEECKRRFNIDVDELDDYIKKLETDMKECYENIEELLKDD